MDKFKILYDSLLNILFEFINMILKCLLALKHLFKKNYSENFFLFFFPPLLSVKAQDVPIINTFTCCILFYLLGTTLCVLCVFWR